MKNDHSIGKSKQFESKAVPTFNSSVVCGFLQISWNDVGNEGVDWSMNCDFPGNGFEKQYTEGKNCGPLCQSWYPSCTHFTWTKVEVNNQSCFNY